MLEKFRPARLQQESPEATQKEEAEKLNYTDLLTLLYLCEASSEHVIRVVNLKLQRSWMWSRLPWRRPYDGEWCDGEWYVVSYDGSGPNFAIFEKTNWP